jgi:outer membrane protein
VRSNNFALQSNLVLFNGFQKVNTLKQNQINLMASNFNLDVLKNDISLSVAGYYLDMLFNMELLDVARNQMEITAQQVKRIEKMVDAGSSAKGDLLNIQAQFSAEELTTVEAENRLTISSLTLQQLIDLPVTRDFKIDKPRLKEVAAPKELVTPEVIYERALKARPEIRSAELAVESAQKSLAIARGTVSPSLSFSGSWATGYSGLEKIVDSSVPPVVTTEPIGFVQHTYDTVMGYYSTPATKLKPFGNQLDDNNNKSLGFYLRIPIFNGWQGRTAITQAKIQKTQAEIDLDIRKRDLRKTIEQAYADAVAALKKYNTSLEKVAAQTESFNYTQQKFDVGMLTSYDYNNSKKELTRAESELLQAKYDFIFKTTVIDFYMGNPIRIE